MLYTYRCRNSSQTAETVKNDLLCADIACFYRNNCDTDYRYDNMCAGYACCKQLLGALDVIMIFVLLSIFKRAFGTGKDKK